jgi:glycosyltransferase involved in cell wall biosynthesis
MTRVLALTSRLPYPPREGHQLRSWHVLRALARQHEVTLLSFARRDDAPDECEPLRQALARVQMFPIPSEHRRSALLAAALHGLAGPTPFVVHKYASDAMRARIAQLAAQADVVHVDMLPLMALLPEKLEVPVVLNAHNVEHRLLAQRAEVERGALRRAFLRTQRVKLERFERAALVRADHVLACSGDDAAQLAALAPQTPITVLPNGVDAQANRPSGAPTAPDEIVFVGQMGWFPNRDGVEWFLAEILPRIVARRPTVKFALVGKSAGLAVPLALQNNVRLLGFVPDVAPPIQAAALYVVPLRAGSGTRLKILEAMAFGKAIVTTRIGAEGIALEHEVDAVFADDAESFAAAVLRLLDAPAEAARLGAAAREKAVARYDWEAIGAALGPLYSELAEAL